VPGGEEAAGSGREGNVRGKGAENGAGDARKRSTEGKKDLPPKERTKNVARGATPICPEEKSGGEKKRGPDSNSRCRKGASGKTEKDKHREGEKKSPGAQKSPTPERDGYGTRNRAGEGALLSKRPGR